MDVKDMTGLEHRYAFREDASRRGRSLALAMSVGRPLIIKPKDKVESFPSVGQTGGAETEDEIGQTADLGRGN
jgi:hypothetical protein